VDKGAVDISQHDQDTFFRLQINRIK